MSGSSHLQRRGGAFYFCRRVPKRVAHLDGRRFVRQSIGKIRTMAEGTARAKAAELSVKLDAYWDALLEGDQDRAQERHLGFVRLAQTFGFDHLSAAEITAKGPAEIERRVAAIQAVTPATQEPAEDAVVAVLGLSSPPQKMLSELPDWFFNHSVEAARRKTGEALHGWKTRRRTAFQMLIDSAGGDKPTSELTRADLVAFKSSLGDRIKGGELKVASANRRMNDAFGILSAVERALKIGLPSHADLRFSMRGERAASALVFDLSFLQDRFLATGAMDRLNPEARAIVYALVETGARPKEICNLRPEDIRLDGNIPHIQIRFMEDAELKTDASERDIPLVGAALLAFQAFPAGFPRYRLKANRLSAAANKTLRDVGLLPSQGHKLYSLRHTFENRRPSGVAERLWSDLFGHEPGREKYGRPSLEDKLEILERIALRPPERI